MLDGKFFIVCVFFIIPLSSSLNCTLTLNGNSYDFSGFARVGLKSWDPRWPLWSYHVSVCGTSLTSSSLPASLNARCPIAAALQIAPPSCIALTAASGEPTESALPNGALGVRLTYPPSAEGRRLVLDVECFGSTCVATNQQVREQDGTYFISFRSVMGCPTNSKTDGLKGLKVQNEEVDSRSLLLILVAGLSALFTFYSALRTCRFRFILIFFCIAAAVISASPLFPIPVPTPLRITVSGQHYTDNVNGPPYAFPPNASKTDMSTLSVDQVDFSYTVFLESWL